MGGQKIILGGGAFAPLAPPGAATAYLFVFGLKYLAVLLLNIQLFEDLLISQFTKRLKRSCTRNHEFPIRFFEYLCS